MRRVFGEIILSVLIGLKLHDEDMGDSILKSSLLAWIFLPIQLLPGMNHLHSYPQVNPAFLL